MRRWWECFGRYNNDSETCKRDCTRAVDCRKKKLDDKKEEMNWK